MITGPSMMALMVRRRRSPARRVRAGARGLRRAVHANSPRQRQDPGRQADAPDRTRRPRDSTTGNSTGSAGRVARRRLLDERRAAADDPRASANAPSSMRVWNASSSATISSTRSSELSPSSSSVVVGARFVAPGVLGDQRRERVAARAATRRRRAAALHPVADGRPLQLARAFGPRQFRLGPHQRAADLLVIVELRVGLPARSRPASTPGSSDQHGVHALLAAAASARRRPPNRARRACWFSTRSTSSGKTFSPSGVTIISFLRPRMNSWPSCADLADVAGVEPAVLERARGLLGGVEVPVVTFSPRTRISPSRRNLDLDAGDRLADRSAASCRTDD